MNTLFVDNVFIGFMVSEISRVSVFGYFPLSFSSLIIEYIFHNLFLFLLYLLNPQL